MSSFVAVLVASGLAAIQISVASANPLSSIHIRQTVSNPYDLSYINSAASIGDSYSSGIGAGSSLDSGCARYDQAYPWLIRNLLPAAGQKNFYFGACSGALSSEILKNQVPKLGIGHQFVTVSAGGNDVGLTDLLDACVFGWSSKSSQCDEQIQISKNLIKDNLQQNLKALYDGIKSKISKDTFVYVTPYAKFFNADTKQCDSVTWAIFLNWSNKQTLNKLQRTRLNELVDLVNAKIAAAVKEAGDHFVLISYDDDFRRYAGRYCEEGINEPGGSQKTDAASRPGLLFYEWDTNDDAGALAARDVSIPMVSSTIAPPGTFEHDVEERVRKTMDENPDVIPVWAITRSPSMEGLLNNDTEVITDVLEARQLIPDTIKRVFHPRPLGHAIIADKVLKAIASKRGTLNRRAQACPVGDGPVTTGPVDTTPKCYPGDGSLKIQGSVSTTVGNKDANSVLAAMREVLCGNKCEKPKDYNGDYAAATPYKNGNACEIAIAIPGSIELYMVREGPATGDLQQQCWDSTLKVIQSCVNNAANVGWWNGPTPGQFYQGGVRKLNPPEAHHSALRAALGPAKQSGDAPDVKITASVMPESTQHPTCGTKAPGLTSPSACLSILGGLINGKKLDASTTFNTANDCLQKGITTSAGAGGEVSHWCKLAVNQNCALVFNIKSGQGGNFPKDVDMKGDFIIQAIKSLANTCPGPDVTAVMYGPDTQVGVGYTSYCMVHKDSPGICAVN